MEVELAAMEDTAMALTDREKALITRAREYMAAGRLPRRVPTAVVAGSGKGKICSLCDYIIGPEKVQYQFTGDDWVTHHFHVRCCSIWQLAASENISEN